MGMSTAVVFECSSSSPQRGTPVDSFDAASPPHFPSQPKLPNVQRSISTRQAETVTLLTFVLGLGVLLPEASNCQ